MGFIIKNNNSNAEFDFLDFLDFLDFKFSISRFKILFQTFINAIKFTLSNCIYSYLHGHNYNYNIEMYQGE